MTCPARILLLVAALVVAPPTHAQQPTKTLAFEVATIKPTQRKDGAWRLQPTPDGFTGMDISLRQLVQAAYGINDGKLLSGGPAWVASDKFDLEAKFNAAEIPNATKLSYRERANMLQPLLADRFQLKVHFEKKDFPIFFLVVAKGGPKLSESKPADLINRELGITCLFRKAGAGFLSAQGCLAGSLTTLIQSSAGRIIVDKTGLTGSYNYDLHWTPDNTPADSPIAGGPSIFTALEEQLGLKLEPATAPLDTLVIDSAEKPSEN